MASLSTTFLCHGYCLLSGKKISNCRSQAPFLGSFPMRILQLKRNFLLPRINCEKEDESFEHVSVERYPYYSYLDSTSGQYEPASGARAAIPGQELWPEGTASRVRAARAPEPTGTSKGSPSFGKNPGSKRKKYATSATSESFVELKDSLDQKVSESDMDDYKDSSSDFVVYQTENKEKELTVYELDMKLGNPHPFVDPATKKPIEEPASSEDLWWNWRKPEKENWSRWQRRRPDVETVFLKAMAETGQVKLYGERPTKTETALYRARRHLFKEERLNAEQKRLEKIGPIAYYSEWVKSWKGDTAHEAIQKQYEETGEDENDQLIEMFCHQTDREYRIMVGTDVRIKRDPLAMRMREDQIKQIWGGDPVYPTVNYIQEPDEMIDFRGPDFHEPTPNMLAYLMEHGRIIPREDLEKILAQERTEEHEMTDMDDAMARAVDIGENDDEEESDKNEEEEKITRNWSVLKSTPELRKSKAKLPKMEGSMSLEDAVDDSENLTDFLMDFEES